MPWWPLTPRRLSLLLLAAGMLGVLAYGIAGAATNVDLSIPSWNERYFTPDGDDQEDTATVLYCLGQSANITSTVTDDTGTRVRTLEDGVSRAGSGACWNNQVNWDGKDDAGKVVAAGVYTLRLQAVDAEGQTGEASIRLGVELRAPGALTAPAPGDTVSGTLRWAFTPTAGFQLASVAVNCHNGGGGGELTSAPAEDGTFTGSLDTTQCADGSNQIDAWASWHDPFGQSHSWLAPAVAVTVANPPQVSFPSWAERYFSPNGDDQDDTAAVFYCLSEPAKIDAAILDAGGAKLRTLEAGIAHPGSPTCVSWNNTVEWDGKDDAGDVVAAGVYTLRLRAVDAEGQTGEARLRVGVELRTPGMLTSPAPGEAVSDTMGWVFTPTAGFRLESVWVNCHSGSGGGDLASAPTEDGTFTGNLDTTSCTSGSNQIDAWASWHDPFGQSHSWAAPPVAVTVGNPPRFVVAAGSERYFSPNGDDHEDTASVSYCLSEAATVTAKVTEAGGSLVRTLAPAEVSGSPGCSSFQDSMVWDGKDDAGKVVAAGVYTLRLQAVDASGQAGEASVRLGVELRAPGALTSPAAGDTVSGTLDWVFTPTAGFPVNSVSVSCVGGGFLGSSAEAGQDGSFRGSGDSTGCQSGSNKLTAAAGWTDPFGQGHSWQAPAVEVTIGNPPQFTIAAGSERYFSPNGDDQEDTVTVHYCLSEPATVTARITDGGGSLVRTLEPAEVPGEPGCSPGRHSVAWDGKDDAGQIVAAGPYSLGLHAAEASGQTGEATVRLGVDPRTPGALTSPAAGDTLAGLARFVFQPSDGLVPDEIQLSFDTGGSASIYNASPDGTWRTSMYTGALQDGPAALHTSVRFTDPLGATHWWSGPAVPVVIDVTSLPLTIRADPSSGPAPLSTTFQVATSDPQGRAVRYTLDFGDGSTPASGDLAAPYPTLEVPHTYAKAGAYRAVITVTNAAGAASTKLVNLSVTGAGNTAPTATLTLDTTSGSVPLPVTATIVGTDADDPLTYTLDFGDGSTPARGSLPADPVDHTYSKAGTYLVRLAVSDGKLTTVKTTTVVVALDEPLTANAGDDQVVIVDTQVRFDAVGSRPTAGIESYHWAFGDGTSAEGPAVDHTYAKEGSYTATLTVTAAGQTDTDTAVVTVRPTPAAPGLVVTVQDESNNPIGGADLVVIDSDGQKFSATTDGTGRGQFHALPDGSHTIYGWKQGYLPATAKGTVVNHAGAAGLTLKAGQVATSSVTAAPMTYDEILAAGIDPDDPANQHVYEFEIHLAFEPFGTDAVITGYAGGTGSGRGLFPRGISIGGGDIPCTTVCTFSSGGYGGTVSLHWVNDRPQLLWLIIPGKATWLKEFFSVQMLVTNLADPDFTLDHGAASLPLPTGLSLAPTTQPQQATVSLPDIGGGTSAAASWVVRGDIEGSYDITASYAGTLEPFGTTVALQATAAKPLRVWGGSAVEMTVDADSEVYDRYPYRVRIGLTNKADVPIYNAAVELLRGGKVNYIYQPREALEQGTAAIAPGDTFWTDDYILAPEISGELNLERSFVKKTAGDVQPPTKIVSHEPLQRPTTAPTLTAIGLQDRVGLLWDSVPGVTGYEIYSTPDRTTDFPATPVQTVPAGTTSATVTMPQGSNAWFAISSIINGKPTLVHPIVDGQPSNRAMLPVSQAKLSSTASCGADIGVSVQFDDPFFDLTSWSATLDGAPYGPGHGSLSGRRATATFTVKASDIKAGGSRLSITATDSSPSTGPAWTGRISTDCNPIRMLVVGDSIAWGQGLLNQDKYPNLVAEWLRQRTGRGVEYDVVDRNLAHSGAVVDPTAGCTPDHRAASDWYDAGEVPMKTPDIGQCQASVAKTIPADLILVDGCINDVGVLNIVFNPVVNLSVVEKCSQQVTDMLIRLHKDHPNAKIVYTGYYPVVDRTLSRSELLLLARVAGVEKAAVAALTGELLKYNSSKFDTSFRDEATQSVQRALTAEPGTWLEFADPGFLPGDGVFNADSKLFLGLNDPMVAARAMSCRDAFSKLQSTVFCPIASIGHPNEAGARRYAAAIEKSLLNWAAGMSGTPTVKSLEVSPASVSLPKGDSQKLTITAKYSDGSTGDASTLVTLTSDNEAVATADTVTLTVRAVNTGTAQVTAALTSDSTVKITMDVTVGDAVPRKLTLTPTNPITKVGKNLQLAATVTRSDGTTLSTTSSSTWASSNTAVATVSSKGVVRGIGVGTASITAAYRDAKTGITVSGSTVVTVLSGPPQIIEFSPTSGPAGTQVTIRGANLLGVTSVTFGGTRSTQINVDSSSSITAVVPAGARSGFIEVTSALGTTKSKTKFTVRN